MLLNSVELKNWMQRNLLSERGRLLKQNPEAGKTAWEAGFQACVQQTCDHVARLEMENLNKNTNGRNLP